MALTLEQEKRLAYLDQLIPHLRAEQRILYAIRGGAYLTKDEEVAQTYAFMTKPAPDETAIAASIDAEKIAEARVEADAIANGIDEKPIEEENAAVAAITANAEEN